mgnify:FL=1
MTLRFSSDPDIAVNVLHDGGIILHPTDTILGIATRYDNISGIEKIISAKNRPKSFPHSVLVSSFQMSESITKNVCTGSEKLKNFLSMIWPGPITCIFEAQREIPYVTKATEQFHTIAIRYPSHKPSLEIIDRLKKPIITTSANTHQHDIPKSIDELPYNLQDIIDLVFDPGDIRFSGKPSTMISLIDENFSLIREGIIPFSNLKKIWDKS